MYFYVFLQPELFEEAAEDGEDAAQHLLAVLSGLLQNCFLAVFEDDRWGELVKEKLEIWPETMTRSSLKKILVRFKKRKRFLYSISPDYMGERSDVSCVFEQAKAALLDLILVLASESDHPTLEGVEIATRRSYQHTSFESRRSDLAVHGKTCNKDEMAEAGFMEFHFAKALKYAEKVQFCDRVCGSRSLTQNFRYTIRQLMAWLGGVLSDPANCRVVFHMGQPKGQGMNFILDEIRSFKRGPLSRTAIEVHFYEEALPSPTLPHQRFILTDQIALDVDRGLDFLDENTQRCRDTYVNYQKPEEARKLLSSYSIRCISTHVL